MSEERNPMEIVAKNLVEDYVKQDDWRVNENANMAYSLQGLNNYIKEEVTKYYWMNYIYSPEVKQAHVDGRFHLHDSGSLSGYCMGLDLEDLLEVGYYGGPGKVRSNPPSHLSAALSQLNNLLFSVTGEVAGAVAVSNLDTLMAPFIFYDNLTKKQVKQALQEFIFNLNVPTRTGYQSPFSNCTLDFTVPKHMAEKPVLVGGKRMDKTYKEFQKEMDLFNECFFEIMNEGDADGRIFSFPIPTVNVTKNFDWDNPRYKALWDNTAKYGQSYFCNYVSSDMDPADAMSMCCRLRIDLTELKRKGGLFGANPLTGSVSVCTINFPRLGYLHKNDEPGFFKELDELLLLAKEALETRRKYVELRTRGDFYPILKFYLRKTFARFQEYWKNHFSTIATVGMNECCMNMFGYSIGDERGRAFAIKVMNYLREKAVEFQKETGHQYNIEQAPAEATSYRLAKIDKKKYPDIIVADNETVEKEGVAPFYTNSTQLPVNYTDDIFEMMDNQSAINALYTGGSVQHLYLGERVTDLEAMKQLIKTVFSNYEIPYISITPTFSVCPVHGYLSGEHQYCPQCKTEKLHKINLEEERLKALLDIQQSKGDVL